MVFIPSNYKVYSTEDEPYDKDKWTSNKGNNLIHDDAIGFIRQRIATLKGIQLYNPTSSNTDYSTAVNDIEAKLLNMSNQNFCYDIVNSQNVASKLKQLPSNGQLDDGTPIEPDAYYEDDNTLILGEAKATDEDLNDKDKNNKEQNHFIIQMNNMITYIDENIKQGQSAYILIGIPFVLSSTARKLIYNSDIRSSIMNDDFKPYNNLFSNVNNTNNVEWFDTGDDSKFMHYITNSGILIKIGFCYEFTDKYIPAPENFNSTIMQTRKDSKTCNGKVYSYIDEWIRTDDNRLKFDPINTRFYNINITTGGVIPYSQEVSFARLISELDNDDKQTTHIQMTRKNAFINDLAINEPLLCNEDENGNIIVIDGNSRLANAREILKHAKAAPGYEYIRVHILQNVDHDEVEQMKDSAQHLPIVQHSKTNTAVRLYNESVNNFQQAMNDFTPGKYGISSIDVFEKSFYTMKAIADYIKKNNINDKPFTHYANKYYYPVYAIESEIYDDNSNNQIDYNNFSNISVDDFMETIFNAQPNVVKNSQQIIKPIIAGIKSSAKEKQKDLALGFMKGDYNKLDADEVKEKIKEASKDEEFITNHVKKELDSTNSTLKSILDRVQRLISPNNTAHKPNKKQITDMDNQLNAIISNASTIRNTLPNLENNSKDSDNPNTTI